MFHPFPAFILLNYSYGISRGFFKMDQIQFTEFLKRLGESGPWILRFGRVKLNGKEDEV
jgi:hypothetical protein